MSGPDTIGPRFAAVVRKLADVVGKDEGGPVASAFGEVEAAGQVLALAGDVLRRSQAMMPHMEQAKKALAKVDAKSAAAFVAALDVATERKKLLSAMNQAFEAMIDEDEKALAEPALAGLLERDRLASVLAAMTAGKLDTSALERKLGEIDQGLLGKTRMLVGLNETRRQEVNALDSGEKARAWWFSARSRCDRLRAFFSGQDVSGDAHVLGCEHCKRDVGAAAMAKKPAHVDAACLERRESGTASRAELSWMDAHAKTCGSCRRAIEALAVAVD